MPRYRFQWSHHPDRVLLALCRELGLELGGPTASLRRRYGARPDEGFVREAFPVLIDVWLGHNRNLRRAVILDLRAARLGGHFDTWRSPVKEKAYLRGIRNAKGARKILLDRFIKAGEIRPMTGPGSRPKNGAAALGLFGFLTPATTRAGSRQQGEDLSGGSPDARRSGRPHAGLPKLRKRRAHACPDSGPLPGGSPHQRGAAALSEGHLPWDWDDPGPARSQDGQAPDGGLRPRRHGGHRGVAGAPSAPRGPRNGPGLLYLHDGPLDGDPPQLRSGGAPQAGQRGASPSASTHMGYGTHTPSSWPWRG